MTPLEKKTSIVTNFFTKGSPCICYRITSNKLKQEGPRLGFPLSNTTVKLDIVQKQEETEPELKNLEADLRDRWKGEGAGLHVERPRDRVCSTSG